MHALAVALDDADVKVLLVPVDVAANVAALIKEVRKKALQADGILLANVMGRFVALHGLVAYSPGVMVGVKAQIPRGDAVRLEQVFSAGFRSIDPGAEHLEVVDMPEQFDDVSKLLGQVDAARNAPIRGV